MGVMDAELAEVRSSYRGGISVDVQRRYAERVRNRMEIRLAAIVLFERELERAQKQKALPAKAGPCLTLGCNCQECVEARDKREFSSWPTAPKSQQPP
jgi:hypothetical protein